jgi:hypothetical protein
LKKEKEDKQAKRTTILGIVLDRTTIRMVEKRARPKFTTWIPTTIKRSMINFTKTFRHICEQICASTRVPIFYAQHEFNERLSNKEEGVK